MVISVIVVAVFCGQLVHHRNDWPESAFELHEVLVLGSVAVINFQALRRWEMRRWLSASAFNLVSCLPFLWFLTQ